MSEADGWESRSSARARELAQWGTLKDRISPLLANADTWSVTRAQRIASEASRVSRGKPYTPPVEEEQDESPLRVLGRMLEVGADTFRDIVPQEVRDVGGAFLNNLVSGERALNTYDRYVTRPLADAGASIARGLGVDTTRADAVRAQQRPLGTMLGETLEQVPGVGGLLRTGLDVAAAPATILTAGAGGAVGGALRGGGRGGRVLANLIEPVAPRGVGFGGRLAAETAAGVGATEGAQYLADRVESPAAKVGLGLLGGLAGGMAGAGLAAQGRAIARGSVRPQVPAFADDMGSLRLRPEDESGRTVRLYRGDSKPIGTFSMDKTSEGGLFGKGIYLTDKRAVARSYTMKSAEDKIGYASGARSKAQALQSAIQNKAWEFRMNGLDNAAADQAAEQFFRDAEPLDFVNRGDGHWDIRTKPERENITTVKMPEPLLNRMIDAEAPITEQQVEVIRNAVKQRLGYGITRELAKNDPAMQESLRALDQELEYLEAALDPFEDLDSFYGTRFAGKRDIKSVTSGDQSFTWEGNIGERPKFAEVWEYLMRGIDNPAEREKLQTALRRGFGDLGHTGIRYDGGSRIPGSLGKHDAYVVWDEQGLNKLIKGQPLGKSREAYEAEQAAQAASDRVAEMERVRQEYAARNQIPEPQPTGAAEGLEKERRILYEMQGNLDAALREAAPLEAKVSEIDAQMEQLDPRGEQYWILHDQKRMAEEQLARVGDLRRDVRDQIAIVQQYEGVVKDVPPDQPLQGGAFDFGPRASSGTREAVIGDTTITYGVNDRTGIAEVMLVETPPRARRQGSARRAMEQMIREADEHGITLALTADPIGRGGASKTALEKFYQSLGFRKNTGRNADYRVWSQYVRKPKTISGGAGAGGVAPPPALAQVFGIAEPPQGLTRAQEIRNTIKEALGQPFGLVLDDPVATPATQARGRWADQIASASTLEGGQARRLIESGGFEFDDKWGIPALAGKGSIAGNPTLQDVAARLPEYAHYLTPQQVQTIERVAKLMEPYGEVIRQTVGDLSPRGDVMPGGYYLHRGFEPEPEVRISIGGKVGGKAGFEKEAAYDSMAEAIAAGKTPLAPWDSIREYVADVGTRASDRYYADYLKSTTDAAGNPLGLTSADRVPVGLRQRMEGLRSKIAARTQLLQGQAARGKAAEAELGRAERAAQEAGARVVGAYGKRASLPNVTPDDIAAARQSVSDAITESRNLVREVAEHAAALKQTQNGLNARERELVAEAGRLEQTLAEADQLGIAADRLLSETRVTDLIRTPDTTVARYLESGFPPEEQIRGRIEELSKLVTRGADGSPNTGASNVARMQEIGELEALSDIRYALGETGQWDDAALAKLEAVLEDVSRTLEVRDDAAMRARNLNAGGQYGGAEGMGEDLDSLRARAALLFRVWDSGSLEVPVPMLSGEAVDNATRTAVARAEANLKKAGGRALEREQRLLLRQAGKIETSLRTLTDGVERMAERVDLATERGAILGDLDQAARQQLVESRRHERAILAGDRRIGAVEREIKILEQAERRAQRSMSEADVRAQRAAMRAGQTGSELDVLRAERDALRGDWERAKALSRQTPQGRAAIGLNELQGTDFPTQMANAANRILQSEMGTSGRLSQLIKTTGALNNLMRGLRATADLSFTGIQGALGLANDPRAFAKAWSVALRSAKDPNVRAAMIAKYDEDALAAGMLTSRGHAAAGLHQGAGQTEFTLRGGPLKSLTEMPGIGKPARLVKAIAEGSNEAFGTFGDMMRLYHADTLLKRAIAKGEIDQAAIARANQGMIDPRIRAIESHTNLTTGWAPSKFLGDVGDLVQFAPRFFQSQLELSANALMKGGLEGKLARREMLQYLGLAASATVLANMVLGNEYGDWAKPFKGDDGTQWTPSAEKNPNFMRIRLGGSDYSLFGPWDSLLTAMMAAGKGDLSYLARTKASPVVQMSWDLLTGEDFMGNRVEPGANWDFAEWMAKQAVPFSVQDYPALGQQALEGDVAGAGLGLVADTLGIKSSPMTPNEELDSIAQRSAGKGYWELEPYQREAIKQANPDVWQRSIERGSDARQRAEAVRSEYHAKQLKADTDLISGTLTRQQWRDQRSTRRVEQRARLEEIYGDSTKRKGTPRNAYERYLAIIDASVNPETGQPDWEAVDAGLANLSASDQSEIEKSVGVGQTPLSREYARLSKQYYSLPRYKGYTADQAREIDAGWIEVKNASETQLGRLRKIRELADAGVEEAVLKALRARAMGKSLTEATDREQFKKANPRFKVLSGSGKLTEADRAVLAEVLREAA